MQYDEIVRYVERVVADGLDTEGAEQAILATLDVLSRCLPADEAAALAAQLPRELQRPLARARVRAEHLSVEAFLSQVADREGVSTSQALDRTRAVFDGLAEAVTGHELRQVRAQLPDSFETLFRVPAAARWPETHRRRPHDQPSLRSSPAPGSGATRMRPASGPSSVQVSPFAHHDSPRRRPMQVSVTARTTLSDEQKRRAVERLEALEPLASSPVLGAQVRVARNDNPSVTHAYEAEGDIDVNGRLIRARGLGRSADAALNDLGDRLERQLRRLAERRLTKRRETGEAEPGEWRHGDLPAERPGFFPRPESEREVVRRKTFAFEPMNPLQAAADMVDLDHDFYVFQDARSGHDAVVHRLREDGRLGLIAPADAAPATDERWMVVEPNRFSGPVAVQTAVDEMNAVNHRFLYFVDRDTGRGAVIYRRYDGHYGLIEAR